MSCILLFTVAEAWSDMDIIVLNNKGSCYLKIFYTETAYVPYGIPPGPSVNNNEWQKADLGARGIKVHGSWYNPKAIDVMGLCDWDLSRY